MRRFLSRFTPAYDADDGAGSGGGLSRSDVEAIAAEAVKRAAGTGEAPNLAAVASLVADEKEKTATARRELAEARAKLPAEGAVVLSADDAAKLAALKARAGYDADPLGKAAADLDASQTALAEVATLKTQALNAEAAKLAGYDADLLTKYVPGLALRIDGEGDKRVPVAVTKDASGADVVTPLGDYLKAEHETLLPVLTGDAGAQARRGGEAVAQRSAATTAGANVTDADVQRSQRRDLQISL